MSLALQQYIKLESQKWIRRHENYARQLSEEYDRRVRRTTAVVEPLPVERPEYWALDPGFNPYLVRARASCIAHAIERQLRDGTYRPRVPVTHFIPKPSGGRREVSVFQLADSAVSRLVYDSLLKKNRVRLSSRAYAYRADVSAHDAIHYISRELFGQSRVFVAEYDFSKYFDNISHDYLNRILRDKHFLITEFERRVILAFLRSGPVQVANYGVVPPPRDRGIPQGTSISLFLANLAAWELDRSLEKLGVSFVRYADDSLIWANDYSQLCRAVDTLHSMAERIGVPINLKKSTGVRLLVPVGAPSEFHPVNAIEYLGHRVTNLAIGMKSTVIERIQQRVTELLYFNLIKEPQDRTQNPSRLGRIDRDYVTFIWQLRRYLYGDLSEARLRRLEQRGVPERRFRGAMAYFPLVDDDAQLRAFDAWLAYTAHAALCKRARLLGEIGYTELPLPHGSTCSQLVKFRHRSQSTGGTLDLRLPSLTRIAKVIHRAARQYGTESISRPPRYEY